MAWLLSEGYILEPLKFLLKGVSSGTLWCRIYLFHGWTYSNTHGPHSRWVLSAIVLCECIPSQSASKEVLNIVVDAILGFFSRSVTLCVTLPLFQGPSELKVRHLCVNSINILQLLCVPCSVFWWSDGTLHFKFKQSVTNSLFAGGPKKKRTDPDPWSYWRILLQQFHRRSYLALLTQCFQLIYPHMMKDLEKGLESVFLDNIIHVFWCHVAPHQSRRLPGSALHMFSLRSLNR